MNEICFFGEVRGTNRLVAFVCFFGFLWWCVCLCVVVLVGGGFWLCVVFVGGGGGHNQSSLNIPLHLWLLPLHTGVCLGPTALTTIKKGGCLKPWPLQQSPLLTCSESGVVWKGILRWCVLNQWCSAQLQTQLEKVGRGVER